jgi:hypothetical protein
MFALTTLVYPTVLAVLCVGAGLLVDRLSGSFLPAALLPAIGAAALIAVSQLSTYLAPLAPATPYLFAVVAAIGFALARRRVFTLARGGRSRGWLLVVPVLAYGVALAPVLFAGRPTFSSYVVLSDSAIHMLGADFLIHHGQDYAHLDLRNSYGQYINNYYNTSYPSGADTLFGGSAFLLGAPLIWAFQAFNAFVLATASGPAWLLARRVGLDGIWAALAALSATLPALVYGYELIGSVKEVTALAMILTLGALVVVHRRWLTRPPSASLPFALAAAGGVSALGLGFGPWALAATGVAAVLLIGDVHAGRQPLARALLLTAAGVTAALLAALPTWLDLSGSLHVAQNIASTGNPGNLAVPLRPIQLFGAWLNDSYKHLPGGGDRTATYALIAVTVAACVAGAAHIIRIRQYALAGWLALMLALWLAGTAYATTWVSAKALMLTSPVVVLIAWAGLAAMRGSRLRRAAAVLALVLAGGVLASDALQYHASNLAPTARYQELALVNARFAGRGPTLFTDFDEYSLYELRDLDVGGPNFEFPPPALATASGYRYPVELTRLPPARLSPYALIVTRRDPEASRPPSVYGLLWQGAYYQVWGRTPGAPAAIAAIGLSGPPARQCPDIRRAATLARAAGAHLVAASSPELLDISLAHASHPARWGDPRKGIMISTAGRLSAAFAAPAAGASELWLQGDIMPSLRVSLDERPVASIGAQLGGNSVVRNTLTPLPVSVSAGPHRVSLSRTSSPLAPGDGGSAILFAMFLTPARAAGQDPLRVVPPSRWRSLCGRSYDWIEVVRS